MLSTVAVIGADVAPREQMLVHPNRALVLAPASKQIAQREMQFRRVGIVLDGLNEGVNGLVLLLVEQKVQAPEIGFGCLPVFQAQLAHVQPRGQPAQYKGHGQAHQDQGRIKVHGVLRKWKCRQWTVS